MGRLAETDIAPGTVLHLGHAPHCREWVIIAAQQIDPLTGRRGWRAVERREDGFTPSTLTVFADTLYAYHRPDAH